MGEEVLEFGNVRVHIPSWMTDPEKEADLAILNALGANHQELEDEVKSRMPERTGNLAKAFYITDVLPYGKSRYAVRFVFDEQLAPYWKWVVYGRNPDPGSRIYPLTKQALAFEWPAMGGNPHSADGRWVFSNVAMSVVKPNRFVQEGLRSAATKLTGRLPTDFIAFLLR